MIIEQFLGKTHSLTNNVKKALISPANSIPLGCYSLFMGQNRNVYEANTSNASPSKIMPLGPSWG